MGIIEERYNEILSWGIRYGKTSSILKPENDSLTFARNSDYLSKLIGTEKNVGVIIPSHIESSTLNELPKNIRTFAIHEEDNIEYVFTYIHNEINKDKDPKKDLI